VGKVVDDVLRLFRATDFVPASVQIVVRMQESRPKSTAMPTCSSKSWST
jgi:hypothetical protein